MSGNQESPAQRAAIYGSAPDNSAVSIKNQLEVARSCAENNGLEVVREYIDLRGERAQLLRMLADATVAEPPFRKIVVSALSRISRRAEELNQHWTLLGAHGVELISATATSANAVGITMREFLRREHSERVRRGMRKAAQEGFYVFANAPYGYRKVVVWDRGIHRHKLDLNPPASDTARWIFELRIGGTSKDEIAAELRAADAKPPTAHPWTPRDVLRILGNEVYCGTNIAAKQDMANPETAVRVPNAFPAIVTRREFDIVQRMGK